MKTFYLAVIIYIYFCLLYLTSAGIADKYCGNKNCYDILGVK